MKPILESALTLNIKSLVRDKVIKENSLYSGVISWNNKNKSQISILVKTEEKSGVMMLDYVCNGKHKNYKIFLTTISSNLGIGKVWFFICPETGVRCRKLYLNNGYFLHRLANGGFYYYAQTQSKNNRVFYSKVFDDVFRGKLDEELYKPYLKRYYRNKPTKTYKKLLARIERVNNVDEEMLFYGKVKKMNCK